ncbi:nitrous oxide reductase accessory protein NosL [Salinilacihabitans rarus]|uniref:nitrous oxide reductase accessory protein NosL n=1 Tax=Salinilacihabitans rarus TaxID=2961596 RepID=UPI0020C8BAA9|nr:nitrous oxide reductase accessory protein NosL [Salinilacihabitans rarus]
MTGTDRRRFAAAVGATVAGALAGCFGGSGGTDSDGLDGSDDSDAKRLESVFFEYPGDGPVEVGDSYNCPVCSMTAADYPDWNAQLVHGDGTGVFCDTTGCAFAYYVAPAYYDGPDAPIDRLWVTDFETGDFVDGAEASFVLVRDGGVLDDPMRINPRPFADPETAREYAEGYEHEDLDEDDVVDLTDVDYEVAAIYRGRRLPPRG